MPKKKKNYYWTGWVDYGIQKYLNTTNQKERNHIYRKYLRTPFETMAEIVVKRWNWNYLPDRNEDIKHELVSFMISKLHLYKPNKGKSFGYFTLILKNYLIQGNRKSQRETVKRRSMKQLYGIGYVDGYGSTGESLNWQGVQGSISKKENFYHFIEFLEKYGKDILPSPNNQIIEPLISYVRDIDNTKYLYRNDFVKYIKDITKFDNHIMSSSTHTLKNLYRKFIFKVYSKEEMERWVQCLIWR